MTTTVFAAIAEGIAAPRQSARRLLAVDHEVETVMLMIVLAWAVQTMAGLLILGGRGEDAPPFLVAMALGLIGQGIRIAIAAGLITWIGGLFGGKGTMRRAILAVSWHGVISSVLMPMILLSYVAFAEHGASIGLAGMATIGLLDLWILACFVAVLHGFRSPWGTMAMMLGVVAGMTFFALNASVS